VQERSGRVLAGVQAAATPRRQPRTPTPLCCWPHYRPRPSPCS
jgi:hypothetical protein